MKYEFISMRKSSSIDNIIRVRMLPNWLERLFGHQECEAEFIGHFFWRSLPELDEVSMFSGLASVLRDFRERAEVKDRMERMDGLIKGFRDREEKFKRTGDKD
jgi:transcriptional regulator NrdR family protein